MNADDDDFLYGSDNDKDTENKQLETNNEIKEIPQSQSQTPVNNIPIETKVSEEPQLQSDIQSESYSDSDSDSDVEFIIGSLESKPIVRPTTTTQIIPETIQSTTEPTIINQQDQDQVQSEIQQQQQQIKTVPVLTNNDTNGFNINKIGTFNDIPITELSIEELKDKPWRLPGSDLSDYFNYGFNEITWRMYCSKFEKINENLNNNMGMNINGVMNFMNMPGMNVPGMNPMMMNNLNPMNNNNNNNSNNNNNNNNNQEKTPMLRDLRDQADKDVEKGIPRDRDRDRDMRDRDVRDRDIRDRDIRERDRDRDRDRDWDRGDRDRDRDWDRLKQRRRRRR